MSTTSTQDEQEVSVNPVHLRQTDAPFVRAVAAGYATDKWSKEELTSVMSDAMRLVYKIASLYTDPSCFELQQEDLEAAGREKLIARLQKGVLDKYHPGKGEQGRGGLFKHLKACLNNHLKGFVHRNRYTLKRTGRKVPTKEAMASAARKGITLDFDRSFKAEVSLSDPDASAAVERAASNVDDNTLRECTEDLRSVLTPLEFLVLTQRLQPNENALNHATLDMWRGDGSAVQLTIRDEHLAAGVGLDVETFKTVTAQLKPKIQHYMSDLATELSSSYHVAVTALEKVFGLQIHRSLDPLTLKRLLTVAARANFEKVDENVASLLKAVGAQVPKLGGNGALICYGALYQKNNRTCMSCQVRAACAVETANFGLDEITLSPKLLNARALTRTPSITTEAPTETMSDAPLTNAGLVDSPLDVQEDELKSYLHEHFKPAKFDGELYFRHKDRRADGKMKYIFWLGRRKQPGKPEVLSVRFCKPSTKLAAYLEKDGAGYYPPAGMPVRQIIELLNTHASETF